MKQHHQRILRLWRCPECDRTVRLPGRITTRTCRCTGDQTMMQLQETERIRKFDVASFVSYQSEEDLTPTAQELVEEIPQHLMPIGPSEEEIAAKAAKPRRGKAYLRTEIDEKAEAESSVSEADDFGAGIENEPSASTVTQINTPSTSETSARSDSRISGDGPDKSSESSAEGGGRKKRRRRRRRGKGAGRRDGESRDGEQGDGEQGDGDQGGETNSADVSAAASTVAQPHPTTDGDAIPSAPSDHPEGKVAGANPAGKKRRRRRRRRGKTGAASVEGSSDRRSEDSRNTDSPNTNSVKKEGGGEPN